MSPDQKIGALLMVGLIATIFFTLDSKQGKDDDEVD